jgi:hypothetical protein
MRTVAARFADERAFESLRELRARHRLDEGQVEVRTLGSTNYGELPRDLILAGQFDDAIVPDVVAAIEQFGGEVLLDRQEASAEPEAQVRAAPRGADQAGAPQ